MPRSGSTLICNILAQNPEFHVTPTSGLSELIRGINQFWRSSPIIKASETSEKKLQIIRDLMQSYHSDTERPTIFNKSRGWASQIELIENALQHPIKIISTTRKITCILASMEKMYRKEMKLVTSPMEVIPAMGTLEGRLLTWTNPDGLVGGAFNHLKDAVIRGHRDKILFIDFDELTVNPKRILKTVYEFLDKPLYVHDIDNVPQYTKENDTEHGFTDLHTIRPKIQPVSDDSRQILGDSWQQYSGFHYKF